MSFPRLLPIRQRFPDRRLADVSAEVLRTLSEVDPAVRLAPGSTIAIGAGSRGIANLATIIRSVVDYFRGKGMKPFLFPAMGSHGSATAEGQIAVLARNGITEISAGCPIHSQMEVVPAGATSDGIETCADRLAWTSDAIFLVNRITCHTAFAGEIESGLFKMMAIGLGKQVGAERYHRHAYKAGLRQVILSVGRKILSSGKILGGLGIVEDANQNTALVRAIPAETLEEEEKKLLRQAKLWMGRLPVPEVDILIVDEMGKEISGTGMDTKIINRDVSCSYNPWPDTPIVQRIFVRRLSRGSGGNALGIGMADVVTNALVEAINWKATLVNVLTASVPQMARVPLHWPTDKECLERLLLTVGKSDALDVTYAWIRDTLKLGSLIVSENLAPEIGANPVAEITGEPRPLEFGPDGNLPDSNRLG